MDVIQFYSVNDEYGEFSNFAFYEIKLDGQSWQTVEHYFQAQKFTDKTYQSLIKKANSPMLAATLGRDRKHKLRKDWESVKVQLMKRALMAKFTQHDQLKQLLVSTGESKLVEHTSNDSYWGDGGNGKGKNVLGRLLMEVREEVQKI